jgi:signal transduction histidine kinase
MPAFNPNIQTKLNLVVLFVILIFTTINITYTLVSSRYQIMQSIIDNAKIALVAYSPQNAKKTEQILQFVGARALSTRTPSSNISLSVGLPPIPQKTFFLEQENLYQQISLSFNTLFENNDTIIRIIGKGHNNRSGNTVEALLYERPIRDSLRETLLNAVINALFLASLVAAFLIVTIHFLLTRPLHALGNSIRIYKKRPFDHSLALSPSKRNDDIGFIHNEITSLQNHVRDTLKRQDRLAAIGASVSKINHDLRGIIATVSMLIDGLNQKKPAHEFKKATEQIFDTLNKAVELCSSTMAFAKQQPSYKTVWISLNSFLNSLETHQLNFSSHIPQNISINTDPLHMQRVLNNLTLNSKQAHASTITINALVSSYDQCPPALSQSLSLAPVQNNQQPCLVILYHDNGEGFSKKALENLFQPFSGSTKNDGNGLGLPLSQEIVHNLGGSLELLHSEPQSTTFRILLPSHLFQVHKA